MMQHALFVGQYARVGVSVPLIFCHQSETVVKRRQRLRRGVLASEVLFGAFLVASFLFQELSSKLDFVWSEALWNLSITLVTVGLLVALMRLRSL